MDRVASFAEKRVNVSELPSLRAENFPYSGPHPWLDRPDALEQNAAKAARGEITQQEAEQCRYWRENGYIILPNLIEDETLEAVWSAYEHAVSTGTIPLSPEPGGPNDPW